MWRACLRHHIDPWTDAWDKLPTDIQAEILAYDQIAHHDEHKEKCDLLTQLIKSMNPKKGPK